MSGNGPKRPPPSNKPGVRTLAAATKPQQTKPEKPKKKNA